MEYYYNQWNKGITEVNVKLKSLLITIKRQEKFPYIKMTLRQIDIFAATKGWINHAY